MFGRPTFIIAMRIKVKFHSLLRLYLGFGEMILELPDRQDITVRELIDELNLRVGKELKNKLLDDDEIKKGTMVLLNGKNILHLKKLDTVVQDGDVVVFFPPGGGG